MRRRAIIGALLLVGLGVILGATVFRTDIAQATGLAQSVDATIINPLDAGNVKVHEEGTANVNVTNQAALPVHEQGSTQLLFHDRVVVADPPPVVDVSGAREIRIYISTSLAQCPSVIDLEAQEGSDRFLLERILPSCGTYDTRLLEVPGRTLRLVLLGIIDHSADIAIYGRFN